MQVTQHYRRIYSSVTKGRYPIRLLKHCIDKLEKVHSEWQHGPLYTKTFGRSSWQWKFKAHCSKCLISWIRKENQPRDDYMELIEMSLLALGHTPDRIHWRAPGAIYHARWMAKLLFINNVVSLKTNNAFLRSN